ncbi:MAG: nucleoside deaminase [Nanoarchaeota archaeon]|nr:nucleoside deaminase [Nanoarchaeota archaeon]
MDDEFYMRIALSEAKIALKEGNWPIGCVIIFGDEVIARDHNRVYTLENRTAHAEMMALNQVAQKLFKKSARATLYTTYEPCPMCFGAIILNTMGRVVCGVDLDKSGALHIRDNMPPAFKQERYQFEITRGVLAKECAEIFLQGKHAKKLNELGLLEKNFL